MKQVEHKNILPFYGVSMAFSGFCLVFPWYENGNIMDYLKKKPDVNRFDLASTSSQIPHSRRLRTREQLSGAANGLRFLHEKRLVHGALRPVRGASPLLIEGI